MTRSIVDPVTGLYCGFISGSKGGNWLSVPFGTSGDGIPFFTPEAATAHVLKVAEMKRQQCNPKQLKLALS